ncbi:MAG: hypothetical protein E6J14_07195 [Chloroflexi bacterium]|nr:MAG: hypothetical protein E6J14_07195 [Chloroflexota bacterium]
MAAIRESIEIERRPEDVFAYLDALARHGEWQQSIVSVQVAGDTPTKVGTRATETRRVGGRQQAVTYEITEHNPPRSFAFRGIDGPIRPVGRGTVEPLGDGSRSRLTLELDFEGHGIGKLLRPMVVRQARKQVPQDHQRLKQRLESGAA